MAGAVREGFLKLPVEWIISAAPRAPAKTPGKNRGPKFPFFKLMPALHLQHAFKARYTRADILSGRAAKYSSIYTRADVHPWFVKYLDTLGPCAIERYYNRRSSS